MTLVKIERIIERTALLNTEPPSTICTAEHENQGTSASSCRLRNVVKSPGLDIAIRPSALAIIIQDTRSQTRSWQANLPCTSLTMWWWVALSKCLLAHRIVVFGSLHGYESLESRERHPGPNTLYSRGGFYGPYAASCYKTRIRVSLEWNGVARRGGGL